MLCQIGNVAGDGGDGGVDERERIMVTKVNIGGGLLEMVFSSTWPKGVGIQTVSS